MVRPIITIFPNASISQYNHQVEDFLDRQHAPRGSFLRGDEPVDRLFRWVEDVLQDYAKLQDEHSKQTTTVARQTSEIENLSKTLSRVRMDLGKSESACQDLKTRNRTLQQNHINETTKMASEHDHTIHTLKDEYSNSITTLRANHDTQTQKMVKEFRVRVADLNRDHQIEIAKNKKEIAQLVGQLLVNQDGDRPWADNKLKLKFLDVQRLIESITSPNNKEFLLPRDQAPGPELDPTSFVTRAQKVKFHFLLKSKIWEILRQQFFSAPFGFGAFGTGEAQLELLNAYFPWQKVFDLETDDLTIFQSDKLANGLRSMTFQCLNASVLAGEERGMPSDTPLCNLSRENVAQTNDRILRILSQAAKFSKSVIRSELEEDVQTMVNIVLEIALQFGVQPAQLQLYSPETGDTVRIGSDFQDCENADLKKGYDHIVDLVVAPGLQKVGNGRSNKVSKRTIVPCEIYPLDPIS